MPFINQIDQELKSRGYQTVGIGLGSTPEELRSLTQQLGLAYPVLLGNDQVSKAYGNLEFVPTTFIIDRQGRIAHKIFEARSKADLLNLIQPLLEYRLRVVDFWDNRGPRRARLAGDQLITGSG